MNLTARRLFGHGNLTDVLTQNLVVVASLRSVFVGSHGGDFLRIDIDTGDPIWKIYCKGRIEAGAEHTSGVIFVPTYFAKDIEGEGLAFADKRGIMLGVSAQNGEVLWEFSCAGELKAKPIVVDDLLLFGTYSSKVHAIDKETGFPRFSCSVTGNVSSALTLLGTSKVLFATTSGTLEVLCLTQKTIVRKYNVPGNAPVFARAVKAGDGLLVYCAVSGDVVCLDTNSWNTRWDFKCGKSAFYITESSCK